MAPREAPREAASVLRGFAPAAALLALVVAAALCLTSRFGQRLGPTDAVYARAEPSPIAAMRRLFPHTNPAIDEASGQATGVPEDLDLAVAYFRGWMRGRAYDVLRAPDKEILAVAAARLHVLLAARAEDPRLCVQYARAPAGGVARPVSAPSPLLAQAVDDELVQEVTAARAGADAPVVRPADSRPWTSSQVRRRADDLTMMALSGSSRLKRLPASRGCAAYIGAYRLALGLPTDEGAALAGALLARVLAPPPEPPSKRT
jgi:hypothetical protein